MEARRRRRKLMSEINVVPFIDIMLVLLIVFMITSPLITQGVKVDLPQANSEPLEDNDEESLVISINAEGQYFISLGAVPEEDPEPVPLAQIGESVQRIMNSNPGVPVFLEGDAEVNYGKVIELFEMVRNSGAPGVLLITQPPE